MFQDKAQRRKISRQSYYVDLNQVVLLPRLSYLPIDSVIDSVTYLLFPLPPPTPLVFPISYTFLMYI